MLCGQPFYMGERVLAGVVVVMSYRIIRHASYPYRYIHIGFLSFSRA